MVDDKEVSVSFVWWKCTEFEEGGRCRPLTFATADMSTPSMLESIYKVFWTERKTNAFFLSM